MEPEKAPLQETKRCALSLSLSLSLSLFLSFASCSRFRGVSPVLEELPGARRLREAARAVLDFDPLEGPGFQGFYELLRGPEGTVFFWTVRLSEVEKFGQSEEVV